MFKKILEAIKDVKSDMGVYYREISKGFIDTRIEKKTLDSLADSLQYYANLYNQTISANYEDKDNAFEAVVFVPYRGKPVVIKNGEILTTKRTTSFDIDWAYDRSTEVTIRND